MRDIKIDLAVIGAGPAGICAALSAARLGIKTVLIGNRPMLGGNSSSEIRVWTRGATGAGNLFAEEMGIWGLLKMQNLYMNPDANPVFWDEILLDAVLSQENLTLYLNTEVTDIQRNSAGLTAVFGSQQSSEARFRFDAKYYIDATGDGTIGAKAGLPYYMGTQRIEGESGESPLKTELLGSSILYYTRREDHPVRFVPPRYAYGMDEVERIIGCGGRVINEKFSGSDCWWFEYGGAQDTIRDSQDIALELKRLVLGVWNYIKNSGNFDAENYTLEWIGSIAGKRESRRMETEYLLTQADILEGREFADGAFYGGWYMDIHPAGGFQDTEKTNCIQIPVNVYQIPLRCLYHRSVPNLLFAGRNIGTERDAFVSSRVMNTCALSGQAAGTLAAVCIQKDHEPAGLDQASINKIRQTLLKEDMFIPGVAAEDNCDLAQTAEITASSQHDGSSGTVSRYMDLKDGGFGVFPGIGGKRVTIRLKSERAAARLTGKICSAMLPSHLRPGREEGQFNWELSAGEQSVTLVVPDGCNGRFCVLHFDAAPGVMLALTEEGRSGFICGQEQQPTYAEPAIAYEESVDTLYAPVNVGNGYSRPWGRPNQWCAAPDDREPWIQLDWKEPATIRELRLYLDPELSMELPSSRAKHWEKNHLYAPRPGMPAQLVKGLQIQMPVPGGQWRTIWESKENYQRMVEVRLPGEIETRTLRIRMTETWGGRSPAVYEIRIYGS